MTINFLNIFQVLIGIALVGFILIQRAPGATAGSAFGAGASGTVFGAKGSGSFLTKTTALLATAFFIVTLMIAIDSRTQYTDQKQQDTQDLGIIGNTDEGNTQQLTVPDEVDSGGKAIETKATATEGAATDSLTKPVVKVAEDAQGVLAEVEQKAHGQAEQITDKVKAEVKQKADQAEQITDKVKAEVEQKVNQAKQKIDQTVPQSNDG